MDLMHSTTYELTHQRQNPTSYAEYLYRLDSPDRASRYPSRFNDSFRQRREQQALRKLIQLIPPESRVLDLPCGTGRVTRLILDAGHEVIAGDSAASMLSEADQQLSAVFPRAEFRLMQAASTGLPEGSVDAVMCNRLFHHFAEPAVRIAVLREFARVSRGLVIVSFSNAFAADVLWQKFSRRIRGRALRHYFPVSMRQFQREFAEAGLEIVTTRAVLWGLSRMWYVVGRNAATTPGREQVRDTALHPFAFRTTRRRSVPADSVPAGCTSGF
jgi:ubiquinone/menaquinone biosynthesis C-methylase UbiE